MKKFLDFNLDKNNIYVALVLIISIIWVKLFNIAEIQENTIYENIAIIPLIAGIILCLRSKKYKVFFNFTALVLFLLIAREFSYGRVPFCAIEGTHGHYFYQWNHYKYGFLANYVVGAYILLSIVYALVNKVWIDIADIFKKIKFPFWNIFAVILCTILQEVSEHVFDNTVIEEISEFLIYTLIFVIIRIYYKKINKS